MKKILFGICGVFLVLSLFGCKKDQPEEPKPEPTIDDAMIYPETNLDDGKKRSAEALRIYSHGNDVVYFGETFTAEGYEVYMVYYEYDNIGKPDLPTRTAVKIENFSIDTSKVNYLKEGTYIVRITGRVRSDSATSNISITVKADRYESLGTKHLYGLKCATNISGKVGMSKSDIKPMDVFAIYTENKYENGELVLEEERLRSGYTINTDSVDVSKAGEYPVYLEFSAEYGETKITVKTFFILTLGA